MCVCVCVFQLRVEMDRLGLRRSCILSHRYLHFHFLGGKTSSIWREIGPRCVYHFEAEIHVLVGDEDRLCLLMFKKICRYAGGFPPY